jgi:predicted nucleotidyltransferase component of viral defense system
MITSDQVRALAAQNHINETVIFREYLQLVFLQKHYQKRPSQQIYFKGGTAIHLIYQAPRFSEDLDFTVALSMEAFTEYVGSVFQRMENEEGVTWKEKKSLAGKQYLLTAPPGVLPYTTTVALDFSFREEVVSPEHSIIQTAYPVLFTSFIHHLSQEEILAEKIRAVMTRRKGRDLYDLWFLLSKGAAVRNELVQKKLAYYQLSDITNADIRERIASFPKKDFVLDLRPFIPQTERERLPEFFEYLQSRVKQAFSENV